MSDKVTHYLFIALLLGAGVLGVLGVFLMVLSLSSPEYVSQLGLGSSTLLEDLQTNTSTLGARLHLKPVLDIGLFAGSYVLVCLSKWSQERLKIYLANRSHFR